MSGNKGDLKSKLKDTADQINCTICELPGSSLSPGYQMQNAMMCESSVKRIQLIHYTR